MDGTIEQQLKTHASDITLRQTAIANVTQTLEEYNKEHDQICLAATKFGVFLKKYSITPYNDATVAYLDLLIRGERDKINAGGSNRKLLALQEDLQRHKETVKILTRSMNANTAAADVLTEAGVRKGGERAVRLEAFWKESEVSPTWHFPNPSSHIPRNPTHDQAQDEWKLESTGKAGDSQS